MEKIPINIAYVALVNSTRDRFICYAPHVKVVGYGRTPEEAFEDLDLGVKIFFEFHHDNKNLRTKLDALGFVYNSQQNSLERPMIQEPEVVELPTYIIKNNSIQSSGVIHHQEPMYA